MTMVAINDSIGARAKTLLDGWESAWNASDMAAMWQLATDDVHWVNVVGMHWRGKEEAQKAHRRLSISCSKTDRASSTKSKVSNHCQGAPSLRSSAGQ
jgi:uncharacterized protein (TIGR02246 family)